MRKLGLEITNLYAYLIWTHLWPQNLIGCSITPIERILPQAMAYPTKCYVITTGLIHFRSQ